MAGRVSILLYLDNAATSYKKPFDVYESMCVSTITKSVNAGRGGHKLSIKGAEGIMNASESVASLFNIKDPTRIAFTQNATYALNMAIGGVVEKKDHVVLTSMEHNSVLRPVNALCEYTIVWADKNGLVNANDIENAIKPNTKLIAMTHASNVCGTIQPVHAVGRIAKRYKIPFLLDAAQSAGSIDIDVDNMQIDMMAFSGHKGLLGPLGTGGLYVREGVNIKPTIFGGTGSNSESMLQPDFMPDMLHSGTLNTPAIITLGKAVEYIKKQTPVAIGDRERFLASMFIERLKNMDTAVVYGFEKGANRNGSVAFNIGEMDSGEVSEILGTEYEIATRGGWHCAYMAHKTIGSEKTGAVRASFGAFNKESDVKKIADSVWDIIKKNK